MLRITGFALLVAIPLSVAQDKVVVAPLKKGPAKTVRVENAHVAATLIDQQRSIIDKLNSPVTIDRSFDGVPVKDFLEFLSDRYETTILINPAGFKEMGIERPEELSLRIPKMPGVCLRVLLDYALKQINATYLVVGNHLEIVDAHSAVKAVFGKDVFSEQEAIRIAQPRVNVIFENLRLDAALADLADQSGRNVLLDPRLNEAGKTLVTIRLLNTPIDTAVQLVARLHDFDVAAVDNSFVVTTANRIGGLKVREGK